MSKLKSIIIILLFSFIIIPRTIIGLKKCDIHENKWGIAIEVLCIIFFGYIIIAEIGKLRKQNR